MLRDELFRQGSGLSIREVSKIQICLLIAHETEIKSGMAALMTRVRAYIGKIFAAVPPAKLLLAVPGANTTGTYGVYATLALGSALALFLYPHSLTGILAASSGHAIRRNAALLPGYSFMLGLLALVGFFAIAAGVATLPEFAAGFKQFGNNFAVPALFLHTFPSWFVGIAFAAVGIGALVPAAIMSIAAANLYTRNIHKEFFNKNPTDKQEAQMAKWVSLIVKLGALIVIIFLPIQFAIFLQLLGGILIIQTLPSVMLGVYTRWFNDWALLVGWAVGTAAGIWMFTAANNTPNFRSMSAVSPCSATRRFTPSCSI